LKTESKLTSAIELGNRIQLRCLTAMNVGSQTIAISYDSIRLFGRFERASSEPSSIWDRLAAKAINEPTSTISDTAIDLPWPDVLNIVREFGTRQMQQALNFRFAPSGEAKTQIQRFSEEFRQTRAAKNTLTLQISRQEIISRLKQKGFK